MYRGKCTPHLFHFNFYIWTWTFCYRTLPAHLSLFLIVLYTPVLCKLTKATNLNLIVLLFSKTFMDAYSTCKKINGCLCILWPLHWDSWKCPESIFPCPAVNLRLKWVIAMTITCNKDIPMYSRQKTGGVEWRKWSGRVDLSQIAGMTKECPQSLRILSKKVHVQRVEVCRSDSNYKCCTYHKTLFLTIYRFLFYC